jgi:hypothetical protein
MQSGRLAEQFVSHAFGEDEFARWRWRLALRSVKM